MRHRFRARLGTLVVKISPDTRERFGIALQDDNESSALTRPILEGLLDEIAQRHDHAPPIPQANDHMARGDFLDIAPLVVDEKRIVDADRLGDGKLHAGDEIQHRLKRICFRTVPGESWECFWTLNLEKGQLTVEEPFYDSADSVLATTGGTGEFAGALGE